MKLNKRRKFKRRRQVEQPQPLVQSIRPNQAWPADFMSDALYTVIKYRTFNVLDDYNRAALRIEIDVSLTSERVIRVLEQVSHYRRRRGLCSRTFDPCFDGSRPSRYALHSQAVQSGVRLFLRAAKQTPPSCGVSSVRSWPL